MRINTKLHVGIVHWYRWYQIWEKPCFQIVAYNKLVTKNNLQNNEGLLNRVQDGTMTRHTYLRAPGKCENVTPFYHVQPVWITRWAYCSTADIKGIWKPRKTLREFAGKVTVLIAWTCHSNKPTESVTSHAGKQSHTATKEFMQVHGCSYKKCVKPNATHRRKKKYLFYEDNGLKETAGMENQ